jgi:hypothetical protein
MCCVTNDDSRAAYMVGVALEDKSFNAYQNYMANSTP